MTTNNKTNKKKHNNIGNTNNKTNKNNGNHKKNNKTKKVKKHKPIDIKVKVGKIIPDNKTIKKVFTETKKKLMKLNKKQRGEWRTILDEKLQEKAKKMNVIYTRSLLELMVNKYLNKNIVSKVKKCLENTIIKKTLPGKDICDSNLLIGGKLNVGYNSFEGTYRGKPCVIHKKEINIISTWSHNFVSLKQLCIDLFQEQQLIEIYKKLGEHGSSAKLLHVSLCYNPISMTFYYYYIFEDLKAVPFSEHKSKNPLTKSDKEQINSVFDSIGKINANYSFINDDDIIYVPSRKKYVLSYGLEIKNNKISINNMKMEVSGLLHKDGRFSRINKLSENDMLVIDTMILNI